jgi:long-chain acyl-CoA synthetase
MKDRVAKYAVPKVVKIIDTMPLTEVQEINKKLLRETAKKNFVPNRHQTRTFHDPLKGI